MEHEKFTWKASLTHFHFIYAYVKALLRVPKEWRPLVKQVVTQILPSSFSLQRSQHDNAASIALDDKLLSVDSPDSCDA